MMECFLVGAAGTDWEFLPLSIRRRHARQSLPYRTGSFVHSRSAAEMFGNAIALRVIVRVKF
jgi:hypothetical protein